MNPADVNHHRTMIGPFVVIAAMSAVASVSQPQRLRHEEHAVLVRPVGGMHDHRQQPTHRIDDQMQFASGVLPTAVVPARAACSRVHRQKRP